MKKATVFLLSVCLAALLVGCGGQEKTAGGGAQDETQAATDMKEEAAPGTTSEAETDSGAEKDIPTQQGGETKTDTCAFQSLYYQADRVHQGPLPVPVRLMMDEFCNVALPSDFGKIQSTMRSRNIMSTIVLQNISGLKALFKDDWEGLLGNADTLLYLGGNEQSTHKYISEMLGKETLDVRHRSTTRGRNGSDSVSRQQLARELMTPDEVRSMDNRCALLFIRGEKPVMDEKYDLLRHPNLRRTADGGAAPYVHKAADYACGDMRGAFVSLEELILLEGFTE